jgi:predicted transcriptional regulator YheO
MSTINAMRRVRLTNFEHKTKTLRVEIGNLVQVICINLDCSLHKPEDLPIDIVDNQFDELKSKWAELISATAEIKRLEEELK